MGCLPQGCVLWSQVPTGLVGLTDCIQHCRVLFVDVNSQRVLPRNVRNVHVINKDRHEQYEVVTRDVSVAGSALTQAAKLLQSLLRVGRLVL